MSCFKAGFCFYAEWIERVAPVLEGGPRPHRPGPPRQGSQDRLRHQKGNRAEYSYLYFDGHTKQKKKRLSKTQIKSLRQKQVLR